MRYLSSEEAGVLQLGDVQLHVPALSVVALAALQQDGLGVEAALAIAGDPSDGVHRLLREVQLPSATGRLRWLTWERAEFRYHITDGSGCRQPAPPRFCRAK